MEKHQRLYGAAIVFGILSLATSPTIIGGIVFGLLGIGALIKGYEAQTGTRPWWSKSVVTLWRERGETND